VNKPNGEYCSRKKANEKTEEAPSNIRQKLVSKQSTGYTGYESYRRTNCKGHFLLDPSLCLTDLAIVLAALLNATVEKKRLKPRTPDPAAFAFRVMQHVIEAAGDKPDEKQPDPAKAPAAVAPWRKGGWARAAKMTKQQRSAAAKKAAAARWDKSAFRTAAEVRE
jgi:hypothetical protein